LGNFMGIWATVGFSKEVPLHIVSLYTE
jgi:hypothetical protein